MKLGKAIFAFPNNAVSFEMNYWRLTIEIVLVKVLNKPIDEKIERFAEKIRFDLIFLEYILI